MRNNEEDKLQYAACEWLELNWPQRNDDVDSEVLWFAVANQRGHGSMTEKERMIEGARLKRMGVIPGVADVFLIWMDGFYGIRVLVLELKSERGKVSPKQLIFHRRAGKIGCYTAFCYNLKDIEDAVKIAGLKPKHKIFSTTAIPKRQANVLRFLEAFKP